MLILTRNVSQKIIIGDDITVEIVGVDRGQVRLGIKAPDDISIHREEIYKRINPSYEPQDLRNDDSRGNRR